jgi:ketosteroid isomerase-like protein
MSVLVLFRWKGDPDHLLASYDRELQHPLPREQPRRQSHTCARADDGMVIVDVWESEDDFRTMTANPEFQQNLRNSGTPEPDGLDVWPVHASIPSEDAYMHAEASRRVVRRYFDLLNGGDPSTAGEILSPEVTFFGPRAPEGIRGREAFIEFVAALRRDSPDLRFAEGETVAEGDRVATVFTMTRTHRNEEGQAKMIVTAGMDLFHVADGRIHRIDAYFDRLGMLVEMGVLEPPPQV